VPVVLLIAAIVVVAGIVFVATGRGGEMSYEQVDHAPLELGPVSATDVVLLRPPTALWGYNTQVTDEALDRIATAIRDRDVLIVSLEQQITDLTAAAGQPATRSASPAAAGVPPAAGDGPPAEIAHEASAGRARQEEAAAAEDQHPVAPAEISAGPLNGDSPEPSSVSTNSPNGDARAVQDE